MSRSSIGDGQVVFVLRQHDGLRIELAVRLLEESRPVSGREVSQWLARAVCSDHQLSAVAGAQLGQ